MYSWSEFSIFRKQKSFISKNFFLNFEVCLAKSVNNMTVQNSGKFFLRKKQIIDQHGKKTSTWKLACSNLGSSGLHVMTDGQTTKIIFFIFHFLKTFFFSLYCSSLEYGSLMVDRYFPIGIFKLMIVGRNESSDYFFLIRSFALITRVLLTTWRIVTYLRRKF